MSNEPYTDLSPGLVTLERDIISGWNWPGTDKLAVWALAYRPGYVAADRVHAHRTGDSIFDTPEEAAASVGARLPTSEETEAGKNAATEAWNSKHKVGSEMRVPGMNASVIIAKTATRGFGNTPEVRVRFKRGNELTISARYLEDL